MNKLFLLLLLITFSINLYSIEMVKIKNEKSKDFFISKTEITVKEFNKFLGYKNRKKVKGNEKKPVSNIKWKDAVEYCNWMSEQENLEKCYDTNFKLDSTKNGYRLPLSKEWKEISKKIFFSKFNLREMIIKLFKKSYDGILKKIYVGSKDTMIIDLYGNRWEWLSDGLRTSHRYLRGSQWITKEKNFKQHTINRANYKKDYSNRYIGFRVVKN